MATKKPIIPEVISYLTLRKTLGILGILLPVILLFGSYVLGGHQEIQKSISAYYYTNMGNVLVGVLFSYGLFLFAYKGYGKIDNLAGNIGCIFALGVALLPCLNETPLIRHLHLVSASLLFLIFAFFSIFLFTKSKHKKPLPPKKRIRNRWYRGCGYTILGSMLLMGIYFIFLEESVPGLAKLKPIFWLESLALWAFGISWIIKGKVLFADKK
ncbi:MAG: DUF998 domain-containing protein [Bacteroidota bacterium]|nr:DUF998 domain-containing protein [Bacteroidota bacterium]